MVCSMTHPFGIHHDMRFHVSALVKRAKLDKQLAGRPDIMRRAEALVAVLRIDDVEAQAKAAADLLSQFPQNWPSPTLIARRLAKFNEFDRLEAGRGSGMPTGVRHSLYVFSPIIQLAALQTSNRSICGIPIRTLPLTARDLTLYLYDSMGLVRPYQYPSSDEPDDAWPDVDDEDRSDVIAEGFCAVMGFSIEALVERLIALLDKDPALYVLILSREWHLIGKQLDDLLPIEVEMAGQPRRTEFDRAIRGVYELQRAAIMIWTLNHYHGADLLSLRNAVGLGEKPGGDFQDLRDKWNASPALDMILAQGAMLKLAHENRRDLVAVKDLNAVLAALKSGHLGWAGQRVQGARTTDVLTTAIESISTLLKRPRANGTGHYADRLGAYYGVSARQLLFVAVIEIGRQFQKEPPVKGVESLALGMAQGLGLCDIDLSSENEDLRQKASKVIQCYLPHSDLAGGAGRFRIDAWANRYKDVGLWESFWELVQVTNATSRAPRPKEIRQLHIVIKLLFSRFTALYDRAKVGKRELRIMADLSSSVSQLTTDAVFTLIVQVQLNDLNASARKKRSARVRIRRAIVASA